MTSKNTDKSAARERMKLTGESYATALADGRKHPGGHYIKIAEEFPSLHMPPIVAADPDAASKFARMLPTIEEMRKADKRLEGILAMRVASAEGSPSRTLAELHERMAYGPKVTK